ncbi:hypothetical protein MMC27_005385 [Xylographa pallens]|nr:hypothetical protein [Xylographa pallens]
MADLFGDLQPDTSRGPDLLAAAWTSTSLAIIMVALRIYTRITHKNIGWDDYMILIALALCIFGSVMVTLAVQNGFGRHLYYLPLSELPTALKWSILAEMSAYFATYFIKLSVCFFVFRMISGAQEGKMFVRILYGLMIVVTIALIASVVTLAIECIPFSDIWNLTGPNRRCLPVWVQPLMVKIYGAIGAATDIACVACPVFVVRKLQMRRRIKVSISFLVGLGLFTAGCSIAKSITADLSTLDSTWDLVPAAEWQLLEQNLGTVVACAPALRQLFNRRRTESRPSKNSGNKRSYTIGSGPKKLGGSSGKTTNVTEGTITSDGDTLIPLMDLEAGQPGKAAAETAHSKHDSYDSGGSHKDQNEPWGLPNPARSPTNNRGDVDAIGPAPRQLGNNVMYNKVSPTARSSEERSSEEYIGELGVGVPSPSDYISPWHGPSSAASPDPSLLLSTQARNLERLPVQLPAAAQRYTAYQDSSTHPINTVQSSKQRDGALSIASETTGATTAGLDDIPSFAGSRAQLTASFAGSRTLSRSPGGNVDKPLPPLPLHSRANQYQQHWL